MNKARFDLNMSYREVMEINVAIAAWYCVVLSHWLFRGEKKKGRDVIIRRHQKVGVGSQEWIILLRSLCELTGKSRDNRARRVVRGLGACS